MNRIPAVLALLLVMEMPGSAQEPLVGTDLPGWVGAIALDPLKSDLIVGTSDGTISVRRTSGKVENPLKDHNDAVTAMILPGMGKMFITGGHDHRILVNAFGQAELRGHAGPILAMVWSEKQEKLYSGSMDATIRVWDLNGKEATGVLRDHTTWVNSLALDKAETLLASGSSDQTILVRSLKDLKIVQTFRVPEGEVRSVALSPDGKLLAAGIRYGWVRVWDLETKKVVFSTKSHAGETYAVAFTPDGKTLASGGGDWNQPGEVRLYDVAGWKESKTLKHSGEVLCLAISPDGRWLAAGAWDRTVRIWELSKD